MTGLTDWLDHEVNPIPGKVNQYGRPHNWADDTADILYKIYADSGREAAEAEWALIQERDKPVQTDAVVAVRRFQTLVTKNAYFENDD